MGKITKFYLMEEDRVLSEVEFSFSDNYVKCVEYDNFILNTVFGKRAHTIENLKLFFESRCFEEGRPDKKELLNRLGLHTYYSLDIVRVTHGVLTDDHFWIKFEGENISYKDVRIR